MDEPLNDHDARQLVRSILDEGMVRFSRHAQQRMGERDVDINDVHAVLRSGYVDGCDLERGTWRYRIIGATVCVTVAFRSETVLVVITVWRP